LKLGHQCTSGARPSIGRSGHQALPGERRSLGVRAEKTRVQEGQSDKRRRDPAPDGQTAACAGWRRSSVGWGFRSGGGAVGFFGKWRWLSPPQAAISPPPSQPGSGAAPYVGAVV
jgi:hypothetical protein